MSKIVAKQLAEMLARVGVKLEFSITGNSLNDFNIVIRKKQKKKTITTRRQIQYLSLLA